MCWVLKKNPHALETNRDTRGDIHMKHTNFVFYEKKKNSGRKKSVEFGE